MAIVYLGLGSNLGAREENISHAIKFLEQDGIDVSDLSTLIETDPVDGPPQGKFLNAVLKVQTTHPPNELLNIIKNIESKLGRKKTVVNGPRPIDIDILLYDHEKIQTDNLTIPHPRMFTRSFVMIPFKEIADKEIQDFVYANNS